LTAEDAIVWKKNKIGDENVLDFRYGGAIMAAIEGPFQLGGPVSL
jgi:hypothetical protein